ncbi:hypothetical protein EXE55_21545 [Burkholderia glumae]|uniref:hypothetical protein n=1 Tax=Burkholderia glumae TaxID=337 RepID=UPI001374650B|nr:hypothetical protein [Burkholderia glumae]QHP93482.1 hypothetical protein EXE55_21545 [Burkholderia glumae]
MPPPPIRRASTGGMPATPSGPTADAPARPSSGASRANATPDALLGGLRRRAARREGQSSRRHGEAQSGATILHVPSLPDAFHALQMEDAPPILATPSGGPAPQDLSASGGGTQTPAARSHDLAPPPPPPHAASPTLMDEPVPDEAPPPYSHDPTSSPAASHPGGAADPPPPSYEQATALAARTARQPPATPASPPADDARPTGKASGTNAPTEPAPADGATVPRRVSTEQRQTTAWMNQLLEAHESGTNIGPQHLHDLMQLLGGRPMSVGNAARGRVAISQLPPEVRADLQKRVGPMMIATLEHLSKHGSISGRDMYDAVMAANNVQPDEMRARVTGDLGRLLHRVQPLETQQAAFEHLDAQIAGYPPEHRMPALVGLAVNALKGDAQDSPAAMRDGMGNLHKILDQIAAIPESQRDPTQTHLVLNVTLGWTPVLMSRPESGNWRPLMDRLLAETAGAPPQVQAGLAPVFDKVLDYMKPGGTLMDEMHVTTLADFQHLSARALDALRRASEASGDE